MLESLFNKVADLGAEDLLKVFSLSIITCIRFLLLAKNSLRHLLKLPAFMLFGKSRWIALYVAQVNNSNFILEAPIKVHPSILKNSWRCCGKSMPPGLRKDFIRYFLHRWEWLTWPDGAAFWNIGSKRVNQNHIIARSSHLKCSVKKTFLFAIFTGKHLCRSFFLVNLQTSSQLFRPSGIRSATLLKRDFNTGAFLGILQNF